MSKRLLPVTFVAWMEGCLCGDCPGFPWDDTATVVYCDYEAVEGGTVEVSGTRLTITYEDEEGRTVEVEYEILPYEE